jgi:hypothetical protein
MPGNAPSDEAIADLERALPGVANAAHSLEEIAASIRAYPCVRDVQLADYLLKSNPPQRDFIIECETGDGLVVKRILNVTVRGDRDFEFNGVRDR